MSLFVYTSVKIRWTVADVLRCCRTNRWKWSAADSETLGDGLENEHLPLTFSGWFGRKVIEKCLTNRPSLSSSLSDVGQRVTVVEGMCRRSRVPKSAFENWCQRRHISWLSELPWDLKLLWKYHELKNVRCLIAGWWQFRVLPELKSFVNPACGSDSRSRRLNLSLTWTYRSWRKLHLLGGDWS
jgi:hypothetical protein